MGLTDNRIPEDKLPQCWSDDVRMNALFAPFRIKTANPESWDMKMKFWSDMIRQWCRWRKDPILSASDIKYAFQRKTRTPACIEIVVEEMFRNGEMCPLSKYQQILYHGPEGWVRWGTRLALKPAALAITALTFFLPARQALDNDGLPKASIDNTQRFVLESAVKEQAMELLENYPPGAERIGTIEELMRISEWQQSREIFEVVLGFLVSQNYAVKKDDVVKLAEPNKRVTPVTDTDEALARLCASETRLEADGARLARDIGAATAEAKAALKLGNRGAAKNHLRRKHKLEQRANHCEDALQNVKQLLHNMRDVDMNTAIVHTYKMGAQAMKQGMKEGGLTEDAVHDTMDDLTEVMQTYNEVEKALAGPTDDFDAAELEEELKELLSGPGGPSGGTPGKEKETKSVPKLPFPPINHPTKNKKESERDFIFDGEERVIAELNKLSVDDASPRPSEKEKHRGRKKIAVTEEWEPTDNLPEDNEKKPSKPWYPPSSEALRSNDTTWTNNNVDDALRRLGEDFGEVRVDERLHPGQRLEVDFTKTSNLYNDEFQVQDHRKSETGVWLFNCKDGDNNVDTSLSASTEYFSSESPGKGSSTFQMAPGGERKKSQQHWPEEDATVEELEKRLKNLRGFNL